LSIVSDLVKFAKEKKPDEHDEVTLSKVSNHQAQQINQITGGKVRSNLAPKTLSAHQIRHAIKGHGNDKEEKERGQVGITDADFELVQEIINNPHSIVKADDDFLGNPGVTFIKTMKKGTYHVVMTLKQKRNRDTKMLEARLDFATMYIKK
jgi:hypothetical protein